MQLRIKEIPRYNTTSYFVIQQRFLFLFWINPFRKDSVFHEFFEIKDADRAARELIKYKKSKTIYHALLK
jgi:hypothetical protein